MSTESSLPKKVVAFKGNIDFTNQILIMRFDAIGYRSKCEGKTVSLYRNGELLADGTMSTGEVEGLFPSICIAEFTYHDDTFEAFSQDDAYTVALGDEEPINMAFVSDEMLTTQEMYDGINCCILGTDNAWYPRGDGDSTFSIAQNVQTTKKKYDIKLLPEECLPKSVAKKSEVKSVERVANEAYDTANDALNTANTAYNNAYTAQSTAQSAQSTAQSAQSTAQSAQSTAQSAQSTAQSAQSTAQSAQSTAQSAQSTARSAQRAVDGVRTSLNSLKDTAVTTPDGYSYNFDARSISSQYPRLIMTDYSQHRQVLAEIDENIGLILGITRDGGSGSDTVYNPATIKIENRSGTGGVIIDGLKSIIMVSSTPNSTKQFKITVDDTGTISATEVTA